MFRPGEIFAELIVFLMQDRNQILQGLFRLPYGEPCFIKFPHRLIGHLSSRCSIIILARQVQETEGSAYLRFQICSEAWVTCG